MKKASKILYLVGAILSILSALSLVILGVAYIVLGSIGASYNPQDIVDYVVKEVPDVASWFTVEYVTTFLATAIATGVVYLIFACFSVASAVFAFKARKDELPSRLVAIFNIVFGVLGCGLANAVAGVFSLVLRAREPQAE